MSEPVRRLPIVGSGSTLPSRRGGLLNVLADGGFGSGNSKFVDFMPDVEAISQRRHSPFATLLVGFCCLFVVVAVAWLMLFDVEQVVTAQGVARPASGNGNGNGAGWPAGGGGGSPQGGGQRPALTSSGKGPSTKR